MTEGFDPVYDAEALPADHDTFWCDECGGYHGELSSECPYGTGDYEDEYEEEDGERIIQIVGLSQGGTTPFDGQYVVEYDPGRGGTDPLGRPMLCHLVTTPDREKATRYSVEGAFETWRAVDPENPVRPDGKPNRPLTAFTVSIDDPEYEPPRPMRDVIDPKGRI